MRKLLWPVRIGLVILALVLLPAETNDGKLSGAALCAAEPDAQCRVEVASYCMFEGEPIVDLAHKGG
jgi:hypothetical protein